MQSEKLTSTLIEVFLLLNARRYTLWQLFLFQDADEGEQEMVGSLNFITVSSVVNDALAKM